MRLIEKNWELTTMRQYSFHWILACAYFLIPVLAIQSGEFTQLQHVDLNLDVLGLLQVYLLGSLVSVILVATLVDRNLSKKVEWAVGEASRCSHRVVELMLICCICGLLFFASEIMLSVGHDMSREDRFQLLEGSTGAGFMVFVKVGAFLSALLLVSHKRLLVYVFVGILALVAFITFSRSVLVVVLLTIFPFMRVGWWKGLGGLLLVFFSRLIFTSNFDFSYEWLFTFGLGEMVGVTFGPYLLLVSPPQVDWYDHLRFMLHVLPGFSLINRLDNGFPELTIFVNELADREFGLYGVAGTGYIDLLVSPPTFVFCCLLLLMIFAYIKYCKRSGLSWRIVFSLYCASCMSMISLYRWSLSGFVYSMIRDALIFFLVMLIINYFSQSTKSRKETAACDMRAALTDKVDGNVEQRPASIKG